MTMLDRIAGAPITWGVDPAPGWGHIMDRNRVLNEMKQVGLAATELGPDGWLPTDPAELDEYMRPFGLRIIGGFVPALLYREDRVESELEYVERAAAQLEVSGANVLVLGPSSHHVGYDRAADVTEDEWPVFYANLRRLREIAGRHGLTTALHPHWGMAIETGEHVERLLANSDVDLCLDTGHLYLAGTDPVEIARLDPGRVKHVHLKDVDGSAAAGVRNREVGFREAVIDGMFVPLGAGEVPILEVIQVLEDAGFDGWYVLEQDVSLPGDPAEGEGPMADAVASVEYLRVALGG